MADCCASAWRRSSNSNYAIVKVPVKPNVSTADLIDKLRNSRAASIAMVAAFSDDDLDRRGNHPLLGEVALEDFVKLIYRHNKMHMRDVQRALKLSTWV